MAIVYSYPTATPESQDLLVGTEMAVEGGEDAPRTRTFTIGSISSLISAPLTAAINLKANITSPTFLGTPSLPIGTIGVTQAAGNSTSALATTSFVTTADNLKANIASPTFTGTVGGITKTMVGLSNVDNTTDLLKPISTATQTALDLKANITSQVFLGTPSLPTGTIGVTQSAGNNTTALATTSFVTTADNLKANLTGSTFTGTITAPTIVKTGGSSAQYLMADGSTSTALTLQQVTSVGSNTTSTISINKENASPALIITGNPDVATQTLLQITSPVDGGCISASGINGDTITTSTTEGTALVATAGEGTAIRSTAGGGGVAIQADAANGTAININGGGINIAGAGNANNGYQLQLSANTAVKPSTNTWTIASDSRVKTNINPYTKGLETILAITPITYDYNGKAGFDTTMIGNIGVIAQDVLSIIPESIRIFHTKLNEDDEEKTELYNFDSHALTFILINAVKQLSAEIELLKSI